MVHIEGAFVVTCVYKPVSSTCRMDIVIFVASKSVASQPWHRVGSAFFGKVTSKPLPCLFTSMELLILIRLPALVAFSFLQLKHVSILFCELYLWTGKGVSGCKPRLFDAFGVCFSALGFSCPHYWRFPSLCEWIDRFCYFCMQLTFLILLLPLPPHMVIALLITGWLALGRLASFLTRW